MTSTRFDPKPDTPYATCTDCPETMANREELKAHFAATMKGGSSHRARMTNLGRVERIELELQDLVEEALSEFADRAAELIDRGEATEDEVAEAMRHVASEFSDAWEKDR